MQKPITVNELFHILLKEIGKGKGNAHIYISADDEGNEFHGLYYGITPLDTADSKEYLLPLCRDGATENDVILG